MTKKMCVSFSLILVITALSGIEASIKVPPSPPEPPQSSPAHISADVSPSVSFSAISQSSSWSIAAPSNGSWFVPLYEDQGAFLLPVRFGGSNDNSSSSSSSPWQTIWMYIDATGERIGVFQKGTPACPQSADTGGCYDPFPPPSARVVDAQEQPSDLVIVAKRSLKDLANQHHPEQKHHRSDDKGVRAAASYCRGEHVKCLVSLHATDDFVCDAVAAPSELYTSEYPYTYDTLPFVERRMEGNISMQVQWGYSSLTSSEFYRASSNQSSLPPHPPVAPSASAFRLNLSSAPFEVITEITHFHSASLLNSHGGGILGMAGRKISCRNFSLFDRILFGEDDKERGEEERSNLDRPGLFGLNLFPSIPQKGQQYHRQQHGDEMTGGDVERPPLPPSYLFLGSSAIPAPHQPPPRPSITATTPSPPAPGPTLEGPIVWSEKKQTNSLRTDALDPFQIYNPSLCGVDLLANDTSNWSAFIETAGRCVTVPFFMWQRIRNWLQLECPNSDDIEKHKKEAAKIVNKGAGYSTHLKPLMCHLTSSTHRPLPSLSFGMSEKLHPSDTPQRLKISLDDLVFYDKEDDKEYLCLTANPDDDAYDRGEGMTIPGISLGTFALKNLYYVVDRSRGKVGLAEKIRVNDEHEGCAKPIQCSGDETYYPSGNVCVPPECGDWLFRTFDKDTKRCRYVRGVPTMAIALLVLICLLDQSAHLMRKYITSIAKNSSARRRANY